jgi:hypothetical protein
MACHGFSQSNREFHRCTRREKHAILDTESRSLYCFLRPLQSVRSALENQRIVLQAPSTLCG